MNYELAKKLKDAGFEQNPYGSDGAIWVNQKNDHNDWYEDGSIYSPTLAELIEACKPYFKTLELVNYLNNTPDTWFVIAYKMAVEYRESGNTPEEAVAELWLKLNSD